MLTCMPTRLLASTGAHPANATPWLESARHNLDACSISPMHTAGAPLNGSAQGAAIPFPAQSAAPTYPKQLSIPILLPH